MSTAITRPTVCEASRKKTPSEERNHVMPSVSSTTGTMTSGKRSAVGWSVCWMATTNARSTA